MDQIHTIADCQVTPKFWDNDEKMNAWFAPFRNRDLNPLNYDNKMAFWKSNIELFCEQSRRILFTLAEVKSFFVRDGKMPNCLPLVFQNLINEGSIQLPSDYETSLSSNTWSAWALNKLISSPITWSYQKFISSENSPSEIDENVKYIHLSSLKKQSDKLFKCITAESKDRILTYADIRTILARMEGINIDIESVELIVRYLEREKKVHVVFDKHYNVSLVKFATISQSVIPISDSEISVFVLERKEKALIKELEKLENEKEALQKEVKDLLLKKMRNMAKNTLRKQKELEKRIAKHVNVLENIQNLLYKVQDTETNSRILESYKVGADALKSGFARNGLTLENVDNTMEQIEEALDTHNDIEGTLGRVVGSPAEDTELENELAELLLNDVPSVPPEVPSPGRISYNRTTESSLSELRSALQGSDINSLQSMQF